MAHEIKLYGPIGGMFGFTADELLANIPQDAKEITLRIHSPGGSVGEGLAIYHALRDHQAAVTTIVDGYAASSASFVMLAGDVRQVHRNSIVFVHNPWTLAEGNADELRQVAEGLDVHRDAILDIYQQRTGMAADELREMMDTTAFFRGVDAAENGFATAVIDDAEAEMQVAAMLKFDRMAADAKQEIAGMSKQKTRKEIEQELTDVQAQVAALESGVEVVAAAHGEALAAVTEERDTAVAQVAELTESHATLSAQVCELTARIEELSADVVVAQTEAEKAKAALQSPAVADASLAPTNILPPEASDAEAEAAEKAAVEAMEAAKKEKSISPHYDEFTALKESGNRRAAAQYYQDNKEEINKEQRAIMAQEEADNA